MLSVPVPVRLNCISGSYLCIVDGGQLGVVATKRQDSIVSFMLNIGSNSA